MIGKFIELFRLYFWSSEKYARYRGVKIGAGCNIQKVSFGSEPYLISIGNRVQITDGTKFFTHGGAWVLREKQSDMDFFGKIVIQDNVYIGNNTLIMPGVCIGSNVIVAAGSVVTKSIDDNCIVGGNPAKVIGTVDNFFNKMLDFNLKTKGLSYDQKKNFLLLQSEEKFLKK
ncbi:acyltransferase [Myroides marinus]|uniref:acyltransferase n=1 Tax=Myroides marinus TaxID=703342 RepID=UPI00257899B6|nr:acyltransferase [Myroides marinus]MDM1355967.1 acyltransferase [Myroides marinus]